MSKGFSYLLSLIIGMAYAVVWKDRGWVSRIFILLGLLWIILFFTC